MRDWWTEIWSIGDDQGRTYCGIARTPEGFALDVFRGDHCIMSTIHATWREAEQEASALKRRHRLRRSAATPSWRANGRAGHMEVPA